MPSSPNRDLHSRFLNLETYWSRQYFPYVFNYFNQNTPLDQIRCNVALDGVQDGVNTDFTCPLGKIRLIFDGTQTVPQAILAIGTSATVQTGFTAQSVGGFFGARVWVGFDLDGTKDGANVLFTWPFVIAMDAAGKPAGQLLFRGSRTYYTATDPPPPTYWTLVDTSTLKVADTDAPQAGDVLQWDWAMEA